MVVVDKDTGAVRTVPIEDIGIVLVENQQVSFTIPTLVALSNNKATTIFCDGKKMPCSILLPLEGNTIQSEILKKQIEASEPLKKQLWRQVVASKIKNQASMLSLIGGDGDVLKPYYCNVKSGDSDNREGVAAKIYWSRFLGPSFSRNQDDESGINVLLNYGYAILRSAMCRAIVGSGLSLSQGLFHKGKYNAFPLADDLMEPYRPYVDNVVNELISSNETELTTESKVKLLSVLTCDTRIGNHIRPMELALSMTTASLVKCLYGEEKALCLPSL